MKRLSLLALSILLPLSLTACATYSAQEAARNGPPALTVIHGDTSIQADSGTYSWHSMGQSVEASGVHPLDSREHSPCLTLLPTTLSHQDPLTAALQFELKPYEVTAQCWPDTAWGDWDAESVPVDVTLSGGAWQLQLLDGGYIYEISADWETLNGGGSAYYSFYTSVPDLDNQPLSP